MSRTYKDRPYRVKENDTSRGRKEVHDHSFRAPHWTINKSITHVLFEEYGAHTWILRYPGDIPGLTYKEMRAYEIGTPHRDIDTETGITYIKYSLLSYPDIALYETRKLRWFFERPKRIVSCDENGKPNNPFYLCPGWQSCEIDNPPNPNEPRCFACKYTCYVMTAAHNTGTRAGIPSDVKKRVNRRHRHQIKQGLRQTVKESYLTHEPDENQWIKHNTSKVPLTKWYFD